MYKYCSRRKVQNLVFSNFLLVLTIFLFSEKDWVLAYNSMEFRFYYNNVLRYLATIQSTGIYHFY